MAESDLIQTGIASLAALFRVGISEGNVIQPALAARCRSVQCHYGRAAAQSVMLTSGVGG